jgi:type IV pilus assembly protein PilC
MPYFKYKVKNQYQDSVVGKVEARSAQAAAAELSSRGLLVIDLRPLNEDSFLFIKQFFAGVKHGDIVNFTRQLATMITAGLPLANALSILVQQSKASMSKMVSTLLQDVEGGNSFSKSLEKHPDIFTRIYIQLVNAGEVGGVLDEVLQRLAENMEKEKEFNAKTKGAMIYPAIVILAMIVVAFVMMIFVIPKLTEMYKDFGADLPLPTKMLMALSSFTVQYWYIVIGGAAGGIYGLKRWYKTEAGEHAIDRLMLRLPIFGVLRQKIILTEFARTMSLLLGAGISLLQALEIVTEGISNVIYRDALKEVVGKVEKGVSLSTALGQYEAFPPILYQMISVGEETGKLDEVLMKLAVYFESESEQAVKNMTTAMEPMIMIVLGVGVGVMVIAIIMPIYNLTSQF